MVKRYLLLCASVFVVAFLAYPAQVRAASTPAPQDAVVIPQDATPAQVKEILAGLTDERVRKLLIDELEKGAVKAEKPKAPTGFAGLVHEVRSGLSLVRDRFEYLFSGAASAPRELPEALSKVLSSAGNLSAGQMMLTLAVLTVLWMGAMFYYRRRTASARANIEKTPEHTPWYFKMGRLFLRAVIDLFGLVLMAVVVLVIYLGFFSEGASARPVIFAWLMSIVFLELVKLGSRFLLAPMAPSLRYLPLSDRAAQYLHMWVKWLARIVAVGLLITTLIRLEQGSEALYLLVTTIFGFFIAFILCLLALWNKNAVAQTIREHSQPESLRYQFAGVWHLAAITYVLGFWMFWVFALMVFGGKAMLPGVMTLLSVPLYLIVDWGTQRLVGFAVALAGPVMPEDTGDEDDETKAGKGLTITRFQSFLSTGFRVIVLAGAIFGLLRLWGIDLTVGRAVVRVAFDTLITLVLAYILWVFISRLIERKLMEKSRDEEGDGGGHEGGGPGGDRFSTLMQLLKKFIFVAILVVTTLIILASTGMDIGPLIAGASVFGIAIGFGAQTLVKDIISGIFFLMDDAFRVGDYIETGGARGTVEEISVRSLKLRHHLGFLYTIPFGSMKLVKNNTRDWAIMKLQYLVPFDTDIHQVKKIIKKINKEVRAVPELNEMMLADIKSQGVKAMEEYGMRMRVKFMTKPGGQFTLRKLVLAKMRKHFAEAGIEFARPRVSVQIPDGADLSSEERAHVAAAASKTVNDKAKEKAAMKGGDKKGQ